MSEVLSARIRRAIQMTKVQCNRYLDDNLLNIYESDSSAKSQFISLTMKVTSKRNGLVFNVEDMADQIQDRPVALIGGPGVGKSTLLLKLAIILSESVGSGNNTIPVFITPPMMNNYRERGNDILSLLRLYTDESVNLVKDGCLCIIFDGINEIGTLDVDTILSDIYNLYTRYPFCKYIVSCRNLEFPRKWEKHFDLFSVNPVSNEQILEKFRHDLLSSEDAEKFFRELVTSKNSFLLDMCRNPLLLTLVIEIIKQEKRTDPNYSLANLRNKGEIYRRFCTVLNRYREEKLDHSDNDMNEDDERYILSTLSYYMQCTMSVYIQWKENKISELDGSTIWSVENLLRRMRFEGDSCHYLNLEKEKNGEYSWYQHTSSVLKKSSYFRSYDWNQDKKGHANASFIHQSFGEYFAGIYICDHLDDKKIIDYLLIPRFYCSKKMQYNSKKNWDVIEFASCLDPSFKVLDEVLNFATSYRDSDALLLTSRCLILNVNDTDELSRHFQKIVDDCCIWLLDAFKYWGIAYKYELVYAASRLLPYVSCNFPTRLKEDIQYFSDKYSGGYDANNLPFFFDMKRLMSIASNSNETDEYRADALYTLGSRTWDERSILQVRDFLFGLLCDSEGLIKEQTMKAIKNLLEEAKKTPEVMNNNGKNFFNDEMFTILLSIIGNPNESSRIRTYALNTVAETGNASTIDVFMDYLRNKRNPYRDSASWSLQELILGSLSDYSDMSSFYFNCLVNESSDTSGIYSKGNLVYTLSKIGDSSYVDKLKAWLDSEEEPYVIEDGINAVGQLAGQSEIEYIRKYTRSDDPVIRAKAYESIYRLSGESGLSERELNCIKNDYYSIVRKSIEKPRDSCADTSLSSINLDSLLHLMGTSDGKKKVELEAEEKEGKPTAVFNAPVVITNFNEVTGDNANLNQGTTEC